ncbi:hypothetical protein BaRGS_00037564 [Batillaria attramentaria]|uniref:Uncharacterized protein n=1 Tax=Batillaria attramentaria TaxID=370345 RepID=A0ABD0J8H8_9CAEN
MLKLLCVALVVAVDIFIFLGKEDCYLVEARRDSRWDAVVADHDQLIAFTEAVFHQIITDVGVTPLTHSQATHDYHSRLEQYECRDKHVHLVDYQRPTASN